MAKKPEKKKVKKQEKGYVTEVKEELKKVKWPDKAEMVKYTMAVMVFIAIFALYFYGFDALFAWFKELVS